MKITRIIAREIYDSRGWPTIECEIILDNTRSVMASVPTGLSRSHYEAYELRDGGKRLWGKGVTKALETIENIIAPELIGKEPEAISMDALLLQMDGTVNKSNYGGNTLLAVSMALYRAQACSENIELYELIAHLFGSESVSLPFPQLNFINGGVHGNNNLAIQEFLLMPVGAQNFRASLELSTMAFHELKNILQKYGKSTAVGDEGGFAPHCTEDEALDYLMETLERVSTDEGNRFVIALDIAATQLYDRSTGLYFWKNEYLTAQELINVYQDLTDRYPIYSFEDPLAEDDWDGWKLIMEQMSDNVQIIADDIFATNPHRIEQGIMEDIATAVIIKPNQIGTVTEALQAMQLCITNELNTIVSHRSGETCDSFIADMAVGTNSGQIKAGGCSRSERLSKYNRLLAIEDKLLLSSVDEE